MKRIEGSRMHFYDPEERREIECIVEDINGSMAYVRDEKDESYWIDRRELRR